MKLGIILSILAFSLFASATPAVGDYSKFALTVLDAGSSQAVQGTLEIKILSQMGDAFQVSQNTVVGNQPAQYTEQTIMAGDLANDQLLLNLVTECPSYGGTAEKITVQAGTFDTCKISQSGDTAWYGQVPFGIVQETQIDEAGTQYTVELMSFISGK